MVIQFGFQIQVITSLILSRRFGGTGLHYGTNPNSQFCNRSSATGRNSPYYLVIAGLYHALTVGVKHPAGRPRARRSGGDGYVSWHVAVHYLYEVLL